MHVEASKTSFILALLARADLIPNRARIAPPLPSSYNPIAGTATVQGKELLTDLGVVATEHGHVCARDKQHAALGDRLHRCVDEYRRRAVPNAALLTKDSAINHLGLR